MPNKIAIIDFKNQDVGLKIIFPEAEYFILEEEFDRTQINTKYNINPIVHNKHVNVFDFITDEIYNTLFIIGGLYACLKMYDNKLNSHFNDDMYYKQFLPIIELIKKNKFKNICFFDNYDYDYDPNIIFDSNFIESHDVKFFKRYYNKEKTYKSNVYSFPYIIFGYQCNIEMVTDLFYKYNNPNKISRIFFSGSPLVHIDDIYGVNRDRRDILNKVIKKINLYNPGHLPHNLFMSEMRNSKYSLDLLGVGDPNIRTFEILCSGSLRLWQRSNLKWNFDHDFCEETVFNNENELLEKIIKLENDLELYQRCLNKQNEIVTQHMNRDVLRNYILDKIEI
jgi:hypothetical protein